MSEQLVPFVHEPIRAPRLGFPGECIFASSWREFMTQEAHYFDHSAPMIEEILSPLPKQPTQRHASILASVITWLGTNCGGAMLAEAERNEPPGGMFVDYRYFDAWMRENHRHGGVNRGVRTIEHLLTTGGPAVLPGLSAEELECVEHLMCWLGTKRGQVFLRVARRRVCEAIELDRERRLAQYQLGAGSNRPTAV